MSIGLIREKKEEIGIDLEIPIASTEFFIDNWNVAADEMGIKIFRENHYFGKQEISDVLKELELYKQWAIENLGGTEVEYMVERVDGLIEVIPSMFIDDDTILYIY